MSVEKKRGIDRISTSFFLQFPNRIVINKHIQEIIRFKMKKVNADSSTELINCPAMQRSRTKTIQLKKSSSSLHGGGTG